MAGTLHDGADMVESHEINVTPFIDVVLVLLIVFMIAAPLSTVDVPVDLPASRAEPRPPPEAPLYLTLTADLELALGDEPLARAELAAALAVASGGDRERRIFVRVDRAVDYGALMELMNLLQAAGYYKIALVGLETMH